MSTILERLNRELEVLGRKAQTVLDEGKLQIELLRLRRRCDTAAAELGLLVYQHERRGASNPVRQESLLTQLDDFTQQIEKVEVQLRSVKAVVVVEK